MRPDFPLTRRQLLQSTAGGAVFAFVDAASASPGSEAAIEAVTKGAPVKRGRVSLAMPALAENGFSVFTTVTVESPMSESDYVKAIHLISEKNPAPVVASFFFTPAMAEAKVATNIRLADSQKITALAIMSDGSMWSDQKTILVTIAACIDGG